MAGGRVAAAGLVAGTHGGDLTPGRLGEDIRPSARADLAERRPGALPADDDPRRARRCVPADGRLRRPEPAHACARGRSEATRCGGRDRHARDRDQARSRTRAGSRDGSWRDRDRDRRQRGRHVRGRHRSTRGRERADRADGARIPDHEAVGLAARDADDARPVAPRLLPAGVGRD